MYKIRQNVTRGSRSPKYTEFDPFSQVALDGKEMNQDVSSVI